MKNERKVFHSSDKVGGEGDTTEAIARGTLGFLNAGSADIHEAKNTADVDENREGFHG